MIIGRRSLREQRIIASYDRIAATHLTWGEVELIDITAREHECEPEEVAEILQRRKSR